MKRWLSRSWRWIVAAAVLLGMAGIVSGQDAKAGGAVVEPARPAARAGNAPVAGIAVEDASLDLTRLKREKVVAATVDLFFVASPLAASLLPPPVASTAPPVAPTAPPLPFTYLGKFVDGDVVTLFLTKQEQDYKAKQNDVLDNAYRIEQISDRNVVFTYLPLNIQQTLYVGQAN